MLSAGSQSITKLINDTPAHLKWKTDISMYVILDLSSLSLLYQGNGHERDFLKTEWVHTLDVFNSHIYPGDLVARGNSFTYHPSKP